MCTLYPIGHTHLSQAVEMTAEAESRAEALTHSATLCRSARCVYVSSQALLTTEPYVTRSVRSRFTAPANSNLRGNAKSPGCIP